jgi:hypothetical protein
MRLISTAGLHENDYLMIGDELDQIAYIPDQSDADVVLKGFGGQRSSLLGTPPSLGPLNTSVYKVQILPPAAKFPPNGLPVFLLTERNDDGGPGFAYRLTIRAEIPDFTLVASPDNPNIPQDGAVPVTVFVDRFQGYKGPIEIEVKGLPKGVAASKAEISAEEDSTVVVMDIRDECRVTS